MRSTPSTTASCPVLTTWRVSSLPVNASGSMLPMFLRSRISRPEPAKTWGPRDVTEVSSIWNLFRSYVSLNAPSARVVRLPLNQQLSRPESLNASVWTVVTELA